MIRFQQSILHDPAKGQFGDCLRTCIGCLLHEQPDSLPHFGAERERWRDTLQEWLAPRGFAFMEFTSQIPFAEAGIKGMYHMITGPSPSGEEGLLHCVIGLDGIVVHDPLPDSPGLRGQPRDWFLGFIVAMNQVRPGEPIPPKGYIGLRDVQRKYNIDHSTVLHHVRRNNIRKKHITGPDGTKRVAFNEQELEEVLNRHHRGVPPGFITLIDAMAHYGRSRSTINQIISTYSLDMIKVDTENHNARRAYRIADLDKHLKTA